MHLIWLAQDTESQKLKAKTVALTNIVSQVLLLLPPGVPFTLCCDRARPCQTWPESTCHFGR